MRSRGSHRRRCHDKGRNIPYQGRTCGGTSDRNVDRRGGRRKSTRAPPSLPPPNICPHFRDRRSRDNDNGNRRGFEGQRRFVGNICRFQGNTRALPPKVRGNYTTHHLQVGTNHVTQDRRGGNPSRHVRSPTGRGPTERGRSPTTNMGPMRRRRTRKDKGLILVHRTNNGDRTTCPRPKGEDIPGPKDSDPWKTMRTRRARPSNNQPNMVNPSKRPRRHSPQPE